MEKIKDKLNELINYSDINVAQEKAFDIFGDDAILYVSTMKNKKFMLQNPNGKWVHFGAMGYKDFTRTKDEEKRKQFRTRNHKWKTADIWSPAFLSYHILW